MFRIIKYKTESGECPINNFISDLLKSGQKDEVLKIKFYIDLLEQMGNLVLTNPNWAKKIDEKVYELRPKSNRILYFYCSKNDEYILLHGFKKKTQKTPTSEIERANKELDDYERRF